MVMLAVSPAIVFSVHTPLPKYFSASSHDHSLFEPWATTVSIAVRRTSTEIPPTGMARVICGPTQLCAQRRGGAEPVRPLQPGVQLPLCPWAVKLWAGGPVTSGKKIIGPPGLVRSERFLFFPHSKGFISSPETTALGLEGRPMLRLEQGQRIILIAFTEVKKAGSKI